MAISIDYDVPLPSKRGDTLLYPFEKMEVGHSFFLPLNESRSVHRGYLAASKANKRLHPARFTAREVTENGVRGCRIWRIA